MPVPLRHVALLPQWRTNPSPDNLHDLGMHQDHDSASCTGIDVTLARIGERQHGLVTTADAATAGIGRWCLTSRERAGRMHRVYRGVYALGTPPTSDHARWLAAVLACGPAAALSHTSAARLWQLPIRLHGHEIHVSAQRTKNHESPPQVRLHRPRGLLAHEVTRESGIPVTTVPRTLLDLGKLCSAHSLARLVHEAQRRNLLSATAFAQALAERPKGSGVRTARRALQLVEAGSAGSRSRLEERFLAMVITAGLPEPRMNVLVPVAAGRHVEVDFLWPGHQLCVEVDGPTHLTHQARRDDRARTVLLEAAGFLVLRFTPDQIEPAGGGSAALQQALERCSRLGRRECGREDLNLHEPKPTGS